MESSARNHTTPGASTPEFWRAFEDARRDAALWPAPGAVREDRVEYDLGREGFFLEARHAPGDPAVVPSRPYVQVALVIDHPHARTMLALLHGQRPHIEAELGERLIWTCPAAAAPCRIHADRPADLSDRAAWPELFEWLGTQLARFERVFGPRVRKIFLDGMAA